MISYDLSKTYIQYNEDVLNHKITTSTYIYQACVRMKSWFEKEDRYLDYDDVDKKIRFMQKLKHSKDHFAGKQFILEPYQTWIVSNVIGWRYKETGDRIINEALLVLSRKSGKTFFASALMLAVIMTDGLPGAEGYMIANSSSQASICFNHASSQCKSIDPKGKIFHRYRSQIRIPILESTIQVLSSDTEKLDGFSPSIFIVDEYHSAKSTETWSVLRTGQGIRKNGLGIIISSCGFLVGDEFPLYSECTKAKNVLSNVIEEDTLFAALYQLDEDDDYKNEDVWIKSNPTLDVTVSRKYLREQINSAENNKSLEVSIKTKNFGVWCSSQQTWIPDEKVVATMQQFDYDIFTEDDYSIIGIDIAERSDLCVVTSLVPKDDILYLKAHPFICQTAYNTSPNKELYRQWVKNGYLTLVPTESIDIDYVIKQINDINNRVPIALVAYDPYHANQLKIACEKQGIPMRAVKQGLGSFGEPTSLLEHLIYTNKVVIDKSPVTRWCFKNVLIKTDENENRKPVKSAPNQKIDIIIGFIQSIKLYMELNGLLSDQSLEAVYLG